MTHLRLAIPTAVLTLLAATLGGTSALELSAGISPAAATSPPTSVVGAPVDPGFGTNGYIDTPLSYLAHDIVVMKDGSIVLAGGNERDGFVVVRLRADGSPDSGFGEDGVVYTDRGCCDADLPRDLTVLPDGRTVVVGSAVTLPEGWDNGLMVRYRADGSLDATFGDGGIVLETAPGPGWGFSPTAVAVDRRGRLVVVGLAYELYPGSRAEIMMLRYLPDGRRDPTLAGKGWAFIDSTLAAPIDILLSRGGRAIILTAPESGIMLTRVKGDGIVDQTFGHGGVAIFGAVQSYGEHLLRQKTGKLVVSGTFRDLETSAISPALVRFGPEGWVDRTFGEAGLVRLFDEASVWSFGGDVTENPDGHLLQLFTGDPGNGVARFQQDGQLDRTLGDGNGFVLLDGLEPVTLRTQEEGRTLVAGYHTDEQGRSVVRIVALRM